MSTSETIRGGFSLVLHMFIRFWLLKYNIAVPKTQDVFCFSFEQLELMMYVCVFLFMSVILTHAYDICSNLQDNPIRFKSNSSVHSGGVSYILSCLLKEWLILFVVVLWKTEHAYCNVSILYVSSSHGELYEVVLVLLELNSLSLVPKQKLRLNLWRSCTTR